MAELALHGLALLDKSLESQQRSTLGSSQASSFSATAEDSLTGLNLGLFFPSPFDKYLSSF